MKKCNNCEYKTYSIIRSTKEKKRYYCANNRVCKMYINEDDECPLDTPWP